jgi:hypothetical protein
MQLTITSTDRFEDLDGVPIRVWDGITQDGGECLVFIHSIGVRENASQREFELELKSIAPPNFRPPSVSRRLPN